MPVPVPKAKMKITALDHLVLTVADPDATAAWYARVLGCVPQRFQPADGTTRMALAFGQQKINLHKAGAAFRPHARCPVPGSSDLCFLTDTGLQAWQAHLAKLGIDIEEGPIARTGAQGPITSIYIRDPDGNLIEVATVN